MSGFGHRQIFGLAVSLPSKRWQYSSSGRRRWVKSGCGSVGPRQISLKPLVRSPGLTSGCGSADHLSECRGGKGAWFGPPAAGPEDQERRTRASPTTGCTLARLVPWPDSPCAARSLAHRCLRLRFLGMGPNFPRRGHAPFFMRALPPRGWTSWLPSRAPSAVTARSASSSGSRCACGGQGSAMLRPRPLVTIGPVDQLGSSGQRRAGPLWETEEGVVGMLTHKCLCTLVPIRMRNM